MEQKYVTIGIPEISKDIFRPVIRSLYDYDTKPYGGLWASRFVSNICCISDWHDYLLYQSDELAYKKNVNIGCLFTLKEDAKVLKIETPKQLEEIQKKYPSNYKTPKSNNEIIPDYEKISQDYDGLFLEYENFAFTEKSDIFKGWDVNTLLLFNLDCIKEYQTISIAADPGNYNFIPYITNKSEPKKVIEHTSEYNELYNYINTLFEEVLTSYNQNYITYDNYFEILIDCTNFCISNALNTKTELITIIKNNLTNQGIKTDNTTIVRNITTTILSKQLLRDYSQTKTLKRSLNNNKIFQIIE